MKLKWTKADYTLARKMGWELWSFDGASTLQPSWSKIAVVDLDAFDSQKAAVQFVMDMAADKTPFPTSPLGKDISTCRKAITLCCLGERG